MPPTPKNQQDINAADQKRVTDNAEKKKGADPSYEATYKYAVKSVLDQIDRLLKIDKKDPAAVAYLAAIHTTLNAEGVNLQILNLNAGALTVEIDFEFTKGKNLFTVKLDYDNPTHNLNDPKSYLIIKALVGEKMELKKTTMAGWAGMTGIRKQCAIALESIEGRIKIYPHFGWKLPYKDSCLFPVDKKDLLGHAYITFNAMDMGRAARPKDATDITKCTPNPGFIRNFGGDNAICVDGDPDGPDATADMRCTYIVRQWIDDAYEREKSTIQKATTNAEAEVRKLVPGGN